MSQSTSPLWSASDERVKNSQMRQFADYCTAQTGKTFPDYQALHHWSVDQKEAFWSSIWDYFKIIGDKGERIVCANARPHEKQEACLLGPEFNTGFFPDAHLSYAENILRFKGDEPALIFKGEDKIHDQLSWNDLHALVSQLQQAFKAQGVKRGDRIAAMLPNMPQTIACMLAANSLGAIWSSCSPDFGEQGVLDRFGQIEPTLFITCDGYWYNGKEIDIAQKLETIVQNLAASKTIIIPYLGKAEALAQRLAPLQTAQGQPVAAQSLPDFLRPFSVKPVTFERLKFSDPLYILFSSGTTGIPKCIVHAQGGMLLQHMKEHILHCDIKPQEKVFYFTTCGWMMWNWLASALASQATLMLYDGSPFYPNGNVLFDYAEEQQCHFFGTSAKFIDAVRNAGLSPINSHDLSSIHTIASTGSPLAPENFSFVYQSIHDDVHLASVSGGTDIAACFIGAVPWNPVYSGEIQGPCLGMKVEVWNDQGHPVYGEKGELVCTCAFPSQPIGFWNDLEGKKYHSAYFDRFDDVWCHGDFAEWTRTGGMVIHGRSDATLNPGGVRIGTAEIYNQVEQMNEIEEALCIGQEWQGDSRVVLFVRLATGQELNAELQARIRKKIRTGASPRHVPTVIAQVSDIPRTKSGKITELAVRDIVHGRPVKNQEALANPEALQLFADRIELQ